MFAADCLPASVKKALYLDCDTLVSGTLRNVFETEMDGCPVAMAYDCLRKEYKRYIGLTYRDPYYNSGVMLIDVQSWKAHNCQQKIMEHIRARRRYYPLVDQDLLNIVLRGKIKTLGMENNFLSQCFLYEYPSLLYVYGLKNAYYTEQEFSAAKQDTVIFHFSGQTFGRPWYSNSRHPKKAVYDSYYYASEWKDEPQTEWKWTAAYRIQYVLCRCFPAWVSAFAGAIMQRLFIFITYKI